MKWFDLESNVLVVFGIGSFCFLLLITALDGLVGQSAEASPAVRQLTAPEREWVVECAKYPVAGQYGSHTINDCAARARLLGDWGWL